MVFHGFWLASMVIQGGFIVLLVENTTKLYPGPTIQSRPCRLCPSVTKPWRQNEQVDKMMEEFDSAPSRYYEHVEHMKETICDRFFSIKRFLSFSLSKGGPSTVGFIPREFFLLHLIFIVHKMTVVFPGMDHISNSQSRTIDQLIHARLFSSRSLFVSFCLH